MVTDQSADAARLDALVQDFGAVVEPLGVVVHRVADAPAAAATIAGLVEVSGIDRLLVAAELDETAPDLLAALDAVGVSRWLPANAADARDAPLGLSLARIAVAETGSVLLAEPTLADRAVGMLALTHVVLCPTGSLVPALADAAAALRAVATQPGGGYATLVTGPSRTADIERVLTVGVQGPGRLIVLFVDDLS